MYYPPFPPYPPYPPLPPPQRRLNYWALRRLVKHLPPQSWPEYYFRQSLRAEYRQRRFYLLFVTAADFAPQ